MGCCDYDKAKAEIDRIEKKYSRFKFDTIRCDLPKTEVELGQYKAYIMDAGDPRQVMLGYDTDCSQHLDGVGETAMMYGLAQPYAGFFVIEDKETGKIMAQAEVWESERVNKERPADRDVVMEIATDFLETMDYCGDGTSLNHLKQECEFFCEENEEHAWGDGGIIASVFDYRGGSVADFVDYDVDSELGPRVVINDLEGVLRGIATDNNLFARFNRMLAPRNLALSDEEDANVYMRDPSNKTFMFDSIKFADDQSATQFMPIIARWCEASPYQDIFMGYGYNTADKYDLNDDDVDDDDMDDDDYGLEFLGLKKHSSLLAIPPVDGNWVSLIDIHDTVPADSITKHYSSINAVYDDMAIGKFDRLMAPGEGFSEKQYFPYIGINDRLLVLKFEENIEHTLSDALDVYYKQHPEEKIEQNVNETDKKKHKSRGR